MRFSFTMMAPTARRKHVVRVATSSAKVIKYSSHEGRSCLIMKLPPPLLNQFALNRRAFGTKNAIARVAQAGDDVGILVKTFVDSAGK